MAAQESRKCRKCGRVSDDSRRDGFVSFGRKDGEWEYECPDCRRVADVAALTASTWEIYAALKNGMPMSSEGGFEFRPDISDDACLAAAAGLAASLWEGR